MLVTLRLTLKGGEERLLAQEVADADTTPEQILESVATADRRVPLGDRESCRLDEIVDAVVVAPDPRRGPTWPEADGAPLRDEDVADAMGSAFENPAD